MFSHASVAIWYFNNRTIFIFSEKSFQLLQMRCQIWACYLQVALYYYSKVPKHELLLFHIILYSFSLWLNFSFSCLSNGSKDFLLKELLMPSFLFSNQKFIHFFAVSWLRLHSFWDFSGRGIAGISIPNSTYSSSNGTESILFWK